MFDKSKYTFIPVESILEPHPEAHTLDVYRDRWWAVHDGCVLFWRGYSPQCNAHKSIVERMTRPGHAHETCDVVFLETAYIPVKWTDEGMEPDMRVFENDANNKNRPKDD